VPWPVAIISLDNATFHPCTRECHTSRFAQVDLILCSSEAMAMLLLVDLIIVGNAPFRNWMRESHTCKFLQEQIILCSSEVMAVL